MSAVVVLVQLVATAVLAWRLLRVAQREHYIAGSISQTGKRWCQAVPLNAVVAAVADLSAVVGVVIGNRWVLAGSAILMGIWPIGLPTFRGTPPLRVTARVRRLIGVFVLVWAAVVAVAFAVATAASAQWCLPIAFGVALVALPTLLDGALALARPLEYRLLGRFVRQAETTLRRLGPDVIAITGSFGKTSVKEHVRDLLGRVRPVTASPASFNNQAGLARTVNDYLTPDTEVLICEMGTYGPGEIARMCSWVRPRVAAITRIGPVHLERMKTLEGILAAKSEIFDGAEVAVINVDDPLLAGLVGHLPASVQRTIRCSTDPASGADIVVTDADVPTGVHASNVAMAIGCAVAVGADEAVLRAGIGALMPPAHRLDAVSTESGVLVLDDTFNSNPTGARAGLEALRNLGAPRSVVVTPGMVELGPTQFDENRQFAAEVAAAGAELVIVGRVNRRALQAGYDAARTPVLVNRREDAVAWVRTHLAAGDAVLYENDLPDHYP